MKLIFCVLTLVDCHFAVLLHCLWNLCFRVFFVCYHVTPPQIVIVWVLSCQTVIARTSNIMQIKVETVKFLAFYLIKLEVHSVFLPFSSNYIVLELLVITILTFPLTPILLMIFINVCMLDLVKAFSASINMIKLHLYLLLFCDILCQLICIHWTILRYLICTVGFSVLRFCRGGTGKLF